ncbi:hypothetical protein CBOM_07990 [Ceraceosorus bombacis]|uniref:Uncharacterized protein n=1 Tax=Ceraceosorus bombacis TaxID=401625 RepID=A0A0P1BJ14_9BASI|nr:hypothetical protein CBOM_07990 [Ceraceosorus bombacis]
MFRDSLILKSDGGVWLVIDPRLLWRYSGLCQQGKHKLEVEQAVPRTLYNGEAGCGARERLQNRVKTM